MRFEPFTVINFECQQRLSVSLFQLADAKRFHSSPLPSLVPKEPKFISYLNNLAGPGNPPSRVRSACSSLVKATRLQKKVASPATLQGLRLFAIRPSSSRDVFRGYACHIHCRTCRFSSRPQ